MQDVVDGRSEIHVFIVSISVFAVFEQRFEVVQILLQVFFLFFLNVRFLGIVQNDVQTVGGVETFGLDAALVVAAAATGIGSDFVKCPKVTTGKAVAGNVCFFELADVHAVLAALDFFDEHIDATIDAVDVEVKMLGTWSITACLPKEPVSECVSEHALINVWTMQDPVVERRKSEQAHILAFALFVANFNAITRFGEHGGRLATDLDADVIEGPLGTVGHVVGLAVQYPHCSGNFVGDLVV